MTFSVHGGGHGQLQIYGGFVLSSNGGGVCGSTPARADATPDC
ncbi:MAG TPA: hypothetical protein VHO01_00310 [Jatrophihabitans sp.]|nr:hypothetical protein [Jatrophihabitans sp.]